MPQQTQTFAFGGGLDTNSAALAVPPSFLISGMNYEPLAEGYGRVQGFERFDGEPAPSAAAFSTLAFDGGVSPISATNTITGATSGATGYVLTEPYGVTGSWDDGDAAGTLVILPFAGTFQNNETLQVGGVDRAIANGTVTASSAPTVALAEAWLDLAQDYYRSFIDKVPGEGSVRGVHVHDGEVYAWRNNVGSTKMLGYRATAAGWVALSTTRRLSFYAGLAEVAEGDQVEGATSGASATVVRVQVNTGDWGSSDAVGALHVINQFGAFSTAEVIEVGGTPVATCAGASSISDLAPNGRVRAISHNFYGAANRYRTYGTSGTGFAFEIVSNSIVRIDTGMAIDTPTRIFEIANHLGLIFPGGSVQISATGEPLLWTPLLGAGEIGFGSEVTDVVQANETAVAIFGEEKIGILQGHDANDFVLDTLTEEAGAEADSAQRIARTLYLDRRGLRSLDATQSFGNFKAGALSGRFEKYFKAKRTAGALVVGSYVSRSKSQYRVVWNDGTGFSVYMGGKNPEMIPHEYDDMRPTCFAGGEMADGEGIFCGAEDGYVYRLDSGTSFDGEAIRAFAMVPFNHFGSVMQEKRFHKVTLELDAPARARVSITVQFNYGDGTQPVSGASDFFVSGAAGGNDFIVTGGGGSWDSAYWDELYWSEAAEGIAECYVDGLGRNASFVFATVAGVTESPHVLQAYSVHMTPRRMVR